MFLHDPPHIFLHRLCSLSLAEVILDRPIEPDASNTGFFVAVRMRGSARRVLRSPEIKLVSFDPSHQAPPTSEWPTSGAPPSSAGEAVGGASVASTGHHPAGIGGSVCIDFSCSIQYSHVLHGNSNTLQILLQRRKKYKTKTVNFGYKTLAYCNIDLAQVSI